MPQKALDFHDLNLSLFKIVLPFTYELKLIFGCPIDIVIICFYFAIHAKKSPIENFEQWTF